jgi:hypothetical protein
MTRKTKGTSGNGKDTVKPSGGMYSLPSDAQWGGFLNARLSDEQVEQFKAWLSGNAGEFWDDLWELCGLGAKFTLAYDHENSCYIASITGNLCVGLQLRCCATARAGTVAEAVGLLVFKHQILAGGDWGKFRPKTNTFMSWG